MFSTGRFLAIEDFTFTFLFVYELCGSVVIYPHYHTVADLRLAVLFELGYIASNYSISLSQQHVSYPSSLGTEACYIRVFKAV